MVEILQRAVMQEDKDTALANAGAAAAATHTIAEDGEEAEDDGGGSGGDAAAPKPADGHATPSLHKLASLYLSSKLSFSLFNACAMLHFTSLLIGYALAWSKAFCQVSKKGVAVVCCAWRECLASCTSNPPKKKKYTYNTAAPFPHPSPKPLLALPSPPLARRVRGPHCDCALCHPL